jgi:hypothetical protein
MGREELAGSDQAIVASYSINSLCEIGSCRDLVSKCGPR